MIELPAALNVEPADHDPKPLRGAFIFPKPPAPTDAEGPAVIDLPPPPAAIAVLACPIGFAEGREMPDRLDESFEGGLEGVVEDGFERLKDGFVR